MVSLVLRDGTTTGATSLTGTPDGTRILGMCEGVKAGKTGIGVNCHPSDETMPTGARGRGQGNEEGPMQMTGGWAGNRRWRDEWQIDRLSGSQRLRKNRLVLLRR